MEELLSMVTELREEEDRLRGIRESEKGISWWNLTLPSLRQMCQPATTQEIKYSLPFLYQAIGT